MEPFLTKDYCFQSFHQMWNEEHTTLRNGNLTAEFSEIATNGFWFHLALESITSGFIAAFKCFWYQKLFVSISSSSKQRKSSNINKYSDWAICYMAASSLLFLTLNNKKIIILRLLNERFRPLKMPAILLRHTIWLRNQNIRKYHHYHYREEKPPMSRNAVSCLQCTFNWFSWKKKMYLCMYIGIANVTKC